MEEIEWRCTKRLDLLPADGSRSTADLEIEEGVEGGETVYGLALKHGDKIVVARSEEGFFDALKKLRMVLEADDILLHCCGAGEDVYPSGMQVSFGGTGAYRMRLGAPALTKDVATFLIRTTWSDLPRWNNKNDFVKGGLQVWG